jgi:P4 family phage/plasmid primase-like protien
MSEVEMITMTVAEANVRAHVTQYNLAMLCAERLRGHAIWVENPIGSNGWWMCEQNDNPGIWEMMDSRGVFRLVQNIVIQYLPNKTAHYINGTIEQMKNQMVVRAADFDQHPRLLAVTNGVIDLETGELHDPDPALLLTRAAPTVYDPYADQTLWLGHLKSLFMGDDEVTRWFKWFIGSALIGDASEKPQVWANLYGEPGNGKGTTGRVLLQMLGSDQHAVNLNPRRFVINNGDHLQWMTTLIGARIGIIQELRTQRLDVDLIKTLSGGDDITAHLMRENDRTRQATHSLLSTSNQVNFGNNVVGLKRRYRPLPTCGSLKTIDPRRQNLLIENRSGVLAWAIEGCREWHEDGCKDLWLPKSIEDLRDAHLGDNDWEEFAEYCLAFEPGAKVTQIQISSAINWRRSGHGLNNLNQSELTDLYAWLGARDGVERKRRMRLGSHTGGGFTGVRLIDSGLAPGWRGF